jgi:hypothetical protein
MAAGLVAIAAGALGGWSVTTFVMDTTYRFEPSRRWPSSSAGALATLLAGLAFAIRPARFVPRAFSGTGLTARHPAEAECPRSAALSLAKAVEVAGQYMLRSVRSLLGRKDRSKASSDTSDARGARLPKPEHRPMSSATSTGAPTFWNFCWV